MNTEFKSLKNIETAFQMTRMVMIVVIVCSLSAVCVMAYYSNDTVAKSRDKVYVMENGHSVMMALAQEHNINRPAEAKDHIKTFLKLFFELEPDAQQIKKSIQEASYLGDQSVMRLYKDFVENATTISLCREMCTRKWKLTRTTSSSISPVAPTDFGRKANRRWSAKRRSPSAT